MSTLLDTNLLTRGAQPLHPMHQIAVDAVAILRRQGEEIRLVPQNFYEFWVVATRPAVHNGLGLTPSETQAEMARLKSLFTFLDDSASIFPAWEQLVVQHQVKGKNAHDARLVAAMMVHGIARLLTFNKPDFQRYQRITVISPQDVLASTTAP